MRRVLAGLLFVCVMGVGPVTALPAQAPAPEPDRGAIYTLWPLFDYRSSPATGYRNLSILGPLFKSEHDGKRTTTGIRPLFMTTATGPADTETDILYPIARTGVSSNQEDTQILKLFQKRTASPGTAEQASQTMLFPFYISGTSGKYGPYTSVFPFHGDIYERFWRDEYHYTLFPLYSRTVKKGTTSTNYLYPFFNTVRGENESGFAFWPLYGRSTKTGVYDKRFVLWPFYINEHLDQNSQNPRENLYLLPIYASSRSPQRTATHAPWPFCGVVRGPDGEVMERDIFWPFWMTARDKSGETERYLPFYAESRKGGNSSRWIMWPIYHEEKTESPEFRQEKVSLLYFLFRWSEESLPRMGREKGRSTLWPLYAWKKEDDGVRTLSIPAPVEPVIWNDGIDRNWAPFWRIFISRWDDQGNGATSILWNLFWRERRGEETAWELSPLVSWRSGKQETDFRLLKGLFGYSEAAGKKTLRLLWIPF